ncbi:uncharacterized protein LOC121836790 [Ixodes scapularis]|uniref:uncharacterized protein LOC121836790 n=1 Tax=Ixodes scapularis TaxID=6945 RepID=UPI001C37F964|nr:uncharacterized protein LOC121836790 [Ixodes scapularis]
MPEETTMLTDGDGIYTVTSSTDNAKAYEVFPDVGLCTCRAGGQGAFCRHQGVVHRTVGGVLPNAPVLTPRDRRDLGRLALGENAPPISFYADIHEAVTPDTSDNSGYATSLQESLDAEPSTSSFQSNLDNKEALTQEDLQAMEEECQRLSTVAGGNPTYARCFRKVVIGLRKIHNESQAVAGLLALSAAITGPTRRGGHIRVQPTNIARRRKGVSRGSKRVPSGRPPSQPGPKRARKQAHSLSASIKRNVTSAKSHGQGH